jgi:hypothetical protein
VGKYKAKYCVSKKFVVVAVVVIGVQDVLLASAMMLRLLTLSLFVLA